MESCLRGAFFGAAVGDALGGPAETLSAEEIRERYGVLKNMLGGGWLNLEPGEWTDDTAMMLDVARGILLSPSYPIEEVGHNFLRWFHSGPKDIGNTTLETFKNYMHSGNWKEAAFKTAESLHKLDSNGGLMRTMPITFGYWNDTAKIAKWAAEICMMTHYSPEGATGCIFYNILLRLAADEGSKREMVSRALDLTDRYCKDMDLRPTKFFWHMIKAIQKGSSPVTPRGNALDTLAASLQAFMETETFEAALVDAVNRGEDTDTAGCITGGLAGIYYGYESIPGRWLEMLKRKEEIEKVATDFLEYMKAKNANGWMLLRQAHSLD